ncbi:hypothetical protein [Streptomyces vinaceus]|uniref:hypothetical protein n=1 Tax=Streptomyces vinaceus TaxID=1960 RepID=UPI0035DE5555
MEDWRDWLAPADGDQPWLGHDPTPRIERVGAIIRLWPDTDSQEGLPVGIPRARLPEPLGSVRDELVAFLESVDRWAGQWFPLVYASLVEKLDEGRAISAPLPESRG